MVYTNYIDYLQGDAEVQLQRAQGGGSVRHVPVGDVSATIVGGDLGSAVRELRKSYLESRGTENRIMLQLSAAFARDLLHLKRSINFTQSESGIQDSLRMGQVAELLSSRARGGKGTI